MGKLMGIPMGCDACYTNHAEADQNDQENLEILLATAGKFGGSFLAGRIVGMPARFAARLGVLMNTRGLMELVVLNVGLDIGVISPRLFTMMVIMAIATTAITAPLLDLIPESPTPQAPRLQSS